MLTRGFDPRVGDKDQVTPLHHAAMAGQVSTARVLIAHGAPLDALDGMFAATPLVWAVEGVAMAPTAPTTWASRGVLISAGSPLDWTPPEGAPDVEGTLDGLAAIRAEAARAGS